MKLSQEQIRDLENLQNSQGFKVLLEIEKEASNDLFARLSTFDLDNAKDREIIKTYQIYQRARNDFFQNIESHLTKIFENKIQGIDYD